MWIFFILLITAGLYGIVCLAGAFKIVNDNLHIVDKTLALLFLVPMSFILLFFAFQPRRFLWFVFKFLGQNSVADALLNAGKTTIIKSNKSRLLYLSNFLYSSKTQKEVFEPIVADQQEEYFEALFKKEIWKARWINVRYTYAFIGAMWQKSPIGDLIEFVTKIAKQ